MNIEQLKTLEDNLWKSADTLRANSDLKSTEYATPVLGLIFLKFADNKYSRYEKDILAEFNKLKGTRREKPIHEIALDICGFYLPKEARYDYLLNLPGDKEIDAAIKEAMMAVEKFKPELIDVLPQDEYFRLTRTDKTLPSLLLKNFSDIPKDADGDMFGHIYEYFLGNFALAEGQGGGEFFTPRSVVRLMVEIIEPHDGTVYDPACGSGGMFVQSAQFIQRHKERFLAAAQYAHKSDDPQEHVLNHHRGVFVYGQEKTLDSVKLAKMNLAVNGLRGDIKQANTYYENPFDSVERFDYVLANPPFNVDDVGFNKIKDDPRFSAYGLPRRKSGGNKNKEDTETVPNGNYLWISLFATSLKPAGRAALVMANSASDARHSEADIRKNLIDANLIYGMLTLPSNMFYTVTLPATLWFFDKAKEDERVLFIDARNIFTQVDRSHREFSQEQVQNLAIISRLRRGERGEFVRLVDEYFERGMEILIANKARLQEVADTLTGYLEKEKDLENRLPDFAARLEEIKVLETAHKRYKTRTKRLTPHLDTGGEEAETAKAVEELNRRQRELSDAFAPFFTAIHGMLKEIDRDVRRFEKRRSGENKKTKGNNKEAKEAKRVKEDLDLLHNEIKEAEYYFSHINRLQEWFPGARYEDVTGLCKLATPEDIKEQDYSLNPGRYVGVVIEEDGKTEEEFIEELVALNDELNELNKEARELENTININIKALAGEDD